jgi:phosphotransferase system HPr (HPr) family protein
MVVSEVVIQNQYGLHARPSAAFVELASNFESDVTLKKGNVEVNGKSIMGLLMLAAEKGSKVTLTVTGNDETDAAETLANFLNKQMDYKDH